MRPRTVARVVVIRIGRKRHFERSQDFPFPHEVADVDLDRANVPRDFGVKIYLLVWLKLAGNC
jgi:hypothetical protein